MEAVTVKTKYTIPFALVIMILLAMLPCPSAWGIGLVTLNVSPQKQSYFVGDTVTVSIDGNGYSQIAIYVVTPDSQYQTVNNGSAITLNQAGTWALRGYAQAVDGDKLYTPENVLLEVEGKSGETDTVPPVEAPQHQHEFVLMKPEDEHMAGQGHKYCEKCTCGDTRIWYDKLDECKKCCSGANSLEHQFEYQLELQSSTYGRQEGDYLHRYKKMCTICGTEETTDEYGELIGSENYFPCPGITEKPSGSGVLIYDDVNRYELGENIGQIGSVSMLFSGALKTNGYQIDCPDDDLKTGGDLHINKSSKIDARSVICYGNLFLDKGTTLTADNVQIQKKLETKDGSTLSINQLIVSGNDFKIECNKGNVDIGTIIFLDCAQYEYDTRKKEWKLSKAGEIEAKLYADNIIYGKVIDKNTLKKNAEQKAANLQAKYNDVIKTANIPVPSFTLGKGKNILELYAADIYANHYQNAREYDSYNNGLTTIAQNWCTNELPCLLIYEAMNDKSLSNKNSWINKEISDTVGEYTITYSGSKFGYKTVAIWQGSYMIKAWYIMPDMNQVAEASKIYCENLAKLGFQALLGGISSEISNSLGTYNLIKTEDFVNQILNLKLNPDIQGIVDSLKEDIDAFSYAYDMYQQFDYYVGEQ